MKYNTIKYMAASSKSAQRFTRDYAFDSKLAERRSQQKVTRNAISSNDVGNEKFLGSKTSKGGQCVKAKIDRKDQ